MRGAWRFLVALAQGVGPMRPVRAQVSRTDPFGHLLGVVAVGGTVLELDHGQLFLPGELAHALALSSPHRLLDHLVVDRSLVEGLLDSPARMALDLQPCHRAATELYGHLPPHFADRRTTANHIRRLALYALPYQKLAPRYRNARNSVAGRRHPSRSDRLER